MKKSIYGTLALAAVLTSCSQNQHHEDFNPGATNPNAIQFAASTTRATISTIADIQKQGGFQVFATENGATDFTKHLDGTNDYKFYAEKAMWGWKDDDFTPQWPSSTSDYPMVFDAMYPSLSASATKTVSEISDAITVPTVLGEQKDYLHAKVEAAQQMPSALTLTFKHILSKANVFVSVGTNRNAYFAKTTFKNVVTGNTYNYTSGDWNAITDGASSDSYLYADNGAFLNNTPNDSLRQKLIQEEVAGEEQHMMFVPQTFAGEITKGVDGVEASGTYIETVYRMTNGAGEDMLGFASFGNHPSVKAYNKMNWGSLTSNEQKSDTLTHYYKVAEGDIQTQIDYMDEIGVLIADLIAKGYTEDKLNALELHVKSGYAIEKTLEKGTGYNFVLDLTANGTGGILLEENLVIIDPSLKPDPVDPSKPVDPEVTPGVTNPLPVNPNPVDPTDPEGGKDEGEDIFDGDIDFNIEVEEWNEEEEDSNLGTKPEDTTPEA